MGAEECSTEAWRWRPEPWWLVLSLLGLAVGAVFGVLVVWLSVLVVVLGSETTADPLAGILSISALGGVYGAILGFLCGVAVGLVLTFLVGRDMRGGWAARLAFAGAAVTHAVSLGVLLRLLGMGGEGFGTLVLIGSTVVAGLVAVWFRRKLPARPRLADAHSS